MTLKRVVIACVVLVVVAAAGLLIWARAVLAGDGVRTAVEAQLSAALGQPVTIGSVHAAIFPRVTMNLDDVAIGKPARIVVARLHVGTSLRALLSRRIEHAAIRLAGARIELPLPQLAFAAPSTSPGAPRDAPVEIVSIDTIELTDLEIVSGGRVLRGSVDVVPAGKGLTIHRVSLATEDTSLEVTGTISDLAGPTGELAVTGAGLNVLQLLEFVRDFSKGAGLADGSTASGADPVPMDLRIAIETRRAMVGTLALEALSGRAHITPGTVALDPVSFGVFGGTYTGTLALTLADTPSYRIKAALAGLDAASAMAFAGSAGAMTGRLAGTIDVEGRGTIGDQVLSTARGAARLDVTNGTVAGLGLVRTIVLAGSMRAESQATVDRSRDAAPEPFSRLGATLAIGGGMARTTDLQFESPDVRMSAVGEIGLRARSINLAGDVQLSDALTKQAGRDLVRYTRENGRVTVPVVITGAPGDLRVSLDITEAARRAITNRAMEEAKKAIGRAIGRIIK